MNPYTLSDPELLALLHDDAPCGDATSHALGIGRQYGEMSFHARQAMTLCGIEEAQRMCELQGLHVLASGAASGDPLVAGEFILRVGGPASALHLAWKSAQTWMEYLSGIASSTTTIVAAARTANPAASVVCTRKNFPGTKRGAIKAILSGGASPHRLSLSETLLVFAEHRAFLAGETPSESIARLRHQWPKRAIIVEVADLAEALAWSTAGADILQLEKCPAEEVARIAGATAHTRCRLAAAGGIHADNAAHYVRAGANILVTSAPYFATPRDVAVSIKQACCP